MVLVVKNLLASAGDARVLSSIPGSERSPGGRNGNPLQYSWLENPMNRGAWQAMVHSVAKSWTQLSNWAQHIKMLRHPSLAHASLAFLWFKELRHWACVCDVMMWGMMHVCVCVCLRLFQLNSVKLLSIEKGRQFVARKINSFCGFHCSSSQWWK